jgi:hypothetical protein
MLGIGAVDAPMTTAYVEDVLSNYQVSTKMATPIKTVGRIFQDRPWSIAGTIGNMPKTIPVKVAINAQSTKRSRTFNVNVIDHPLLASRLISMIVGEAIYEAHPAPGDATAELSYTVNADQVGTIKRSNIFFDPMAIDSAAVGDIGSLLQILGSNKFYPIDIKSVNVNVRIVDKRNTATVDRIFVKKSEYEPGETVDVSVTMHAPGSPGSYRGDWKLRNASGVLFGLGPNTSGHFYVIIKVITATASGDGYDFTANVCLAEWTGNGVALPCSGTDGNENGFVLYKSTPVLESGYVDDEPALLTNPPRVENGVIRGKYPAYTVRTDDHFTAVLSCENNAKNCNVRFQLDYQIDDGGIQTLATWNEAYDDEFHQVDVNLSSLVGKKVKFILTVSANGASNNDRALWLMPRIQD